MSEGAANGSDTVVVTMPGRPQCVGLARIVAGEAATQAGLDQETTCDVRLAVSEACTHVLRCAGGDAGFTIRFAYGEGMLDVQVDQRGGGRSGPAESEEEGLGLGLALIHDLAAEFTVHEGERITLSMRFERNEGASEEGR